MNCVAVSTHSSGCIAGGSFPWAKQEFEPTSSLGGLPLSAPQLLRTAAFSGSHPEGLSGSLTSGWKIHEGRPMLSTSECVTAKCAGSCTYCQCCPACGLRRGEAGERKVLLFLFQWWFMMIVSLPR